MYIKKPSYGSDPLRKVSSFGSRRSEPDDYGYNDSPREERRRRSHRSNADYDDEDIPPRRLRSVGRSKSRRDRDGESHRERRREHRDRGERSERSGRGDRDRAERSHRERSHRDIDDEDDSRSHRESRRKGSSRSKSGHGGSSSSKPKAVAPSSKPKVVIPTNVTYRPGRIQTLTADEEVVFKQIWADVLTFCGVELNFDVSDLRYKDCFVASSTSIANTDASGLSRTATRNSLQSATSGKTASSKKKKGFFGGGGSSSAAKEDLKPPPDSRRMREIQTKSSSEVYDPTDSPDDDIINLLSNHYKLTFEYDPDYVSDDDDNYDDDDTQSIESFVTASTTITYPDDFPTPPATNSSGKKGGSSLVKSVPSTPVTTHAEVNANLARMKPRDFLQAFIRAARGDLADNFLLRFVRARKWNTENALKMFSNSIIWRNDFPANDWVMEGDGPSYLHGKNKGLIKNLTAEKSWIRGEDKGSNPIFWFLAKKHFGSDSPSDETQRYAVLTIEWCRLFLKEVTESKDTVSIVFDLTGFTLKNADYTTIKFLADVFEAHYPECLGRIYVHNAPWIFSTVWNIIKNWLDPVVASKIVFTKNFQDLSGYINPDFIPVELGGIDTSGPEYNVPKAGDDVPPRRKDATYRKLKLERDEIYMRFFTATKKWIEATNPEVSSEYLKEKISMNIELSNNYIQLDPYIRNPGPYDRNGLLHIEN